MGRSRLSGQVVWGLGLLALGLVAPMLAGVAACSPTVATGTRAVAATSVDLPPGPPVPEGGLPMPVFESDWQPPSAVAGDAQALAAALATHGRVGLAIDPSLSEAGSLDATHLAALIGKLAPDTAVHPIQADTGVPLGEVVLEDPPLSPTVESDGHTRWATPASLRLDAERLQSWAALGDEAVLLVGPVGVDVGTWRELASGTVGSCEPLFGRILEGQGESLTLLEPFLDYADDVLGRIYLAELAAVVPELEAELEAFAAPATREDFDDEQSWARHQCGQRYHDYLEPFASCVATGGEGDAAGCTTAPRMFLSGAARIGSVEPSDYIPADCPRRLGRDYVEALRAPARAASRERIPRPAPRSITTSPSRTVASIARA